MRRALDQAGGCDCLDPLCVSFLFSKFTVGYLAPDFPKVRTAARCMRLAWLPFGTVPPFLRETARCTREAVAGVVGLGREFLRADFPVLLMNFSFAKEVD